jgi:hypothetical protein
MEIELENKEVDGVYKNMFPCKIDSINIRFIYNVYLIMIEYYCLWFQVMQFTVTTTRKIACILSDI